MLACHSRWVLTLAAFGLCLIADAATDYRIPSITSDGLVNAATGQSGFAPYSICTIYGTDLYLDGSAAASSAGQIPTSIGGLMVFIGQTPAGIFYVSANQINFLIPNSITPSTTNLTVVRNGLASQTIPLVLQEVAPGMFAATPGYAAAFHADGSPVSANSPALPGEVVVLYGTGFGRAQPDPASLSVPSSAAPIIHYADFQVLLDGVPLDPSLVQYAGVAPANAGLYQVNVQMPASLAPTNPQLQVSVAGSLSPTGLQLITGPIPPASP